MPVNPRKPPAIQAERIHARDGSRCHCTGLRKATRRISQLFDAVLEPSGLKITQRAILAQIARVHPATVGQLAEALVMDPGALAHSLKPLQRDGLVAFAVDTEDRRNRLISLTRAGRRYLAKSDVLWAQAQRGFEAAVGRVESETLREALHFLISDDFAEAFERAIDPTLR
jgi:DNA-binding MarR family transcriptional regulator